MGINATKVEKTKLKKQLFNCKIPYDWRIFVLKKQTPPLNWQRTFFVLNYKVCETIFNMLVEFE